VSLATERAITLEIPLGLSVIRRGRLGPGGIGEILISVRLRKVSECEVDHTCCDTEGRYWNPPVPLKHRRIGL
jgi:hypothetical protein